MFKSSGKRENNDAEMEVSWIQTEVDYSKLNNQELQEQNRKILQTLKLIEGKLDKELENQKKNINLQDTQQSHPNREKIVTETIKNNDGLIRVLDKEVKKLKERREELKSGLESNLNTKKYELEKRFGELKIQVKKMKLQEKEFDKKLSSHENPSQPSSLSQNLKLQEQLRAYSVKYMKMLDKYHKVTEQLALASNTAHPELVIPEEFYDQELQMKEEAQYKEYQGIVKLCTVLSKRNDSENNKFNRIYSEKLKELEKTIVNLGQIDRMIGLREAEVIEGKKNIELVKFKISNNQKIEDPFLSLSQSSMRKNSYSLSRLPSYMRQSRGKDFQEPIARKLSKRF